MIKITAVPAFDDNYIWLIRADNTPFTAIVDPGDADPVMEAIAHDHLEPVAILLTHHHGDHVGGVRELLTKFDIPVYGPANENIYGITHPLKQDDVVELEQIGARFEVLDVPGHTRGHIAFYGHDMLFCGDTLFAGGCGRLFEGTPEQMFDSLEKIRALPDSTQVYCAHEYTLANLKFALVAEPDNEDLKQRMADTTAMRKQNQNTVPSALGLEKRTNPFLRSQIPELKQAAEQFAGKPLPTGADVFGTVRYWKDTLD